jgi:hypothetical protein
MSSINPTSFISYGIFQNGLYRYRINYKLEDLFEQRQELAKHKKTLFGTKTFFVLKMLV